MTAHAHRADEQMRMNGQMCIHIPVCCSQLMYMHTEVHCSQPMYMHTTHQYIVASQCTCIHQYVVAHSLLLGLNFRFNHCVSNSTKDTLKKNDGWCTHCVSESFQAACLNLKRASRLALLLAMANHTSKVCLSFFLGNLVFYLWGKYWISQHFIYFYWM